MQYQFGDGSRAAHGRGGAGLTSAKYGGLVRCALTSPLDVCCLVARRALPLLYHGFETWRRCDAHWWVVREGVCQAAPPKYDRWGFTGLRAAACGVLSWVRVLGAE